MKTNSIVYLLFSVFGLGILTPSCKSYEPEPEQVVNPQDQAVYYIVGRVMTGGSLSENGHTEAVPVAGVTVEATGLTPVKTGADGTYMLVSNQNGKDLILTFSGNNYLTSKGSVTLSSTMKGLESVTLNAILTKSNPQVTVSPSTETTVSYPAERSSVYFPVGAVGTTQNISVTTGNCECRTSNPSVTIFMSPLGLKLSKPATLNIKNVFQSNSLCFVKPKLQIESSSSKSAAEYFTKADPIYTWTDVSELEYDNTTNSYNGDINQLAMYKVVPTVNKVTSTPITTSEVNTYQEIDNSDNINALKGATIQVKTKTGWDFASDISASIKNQIPGITDADATQLIAVLQSIAQQYAGSPRGIATLERTETVDVSGNSILIYKNIPTIVQGTLSMPVSYNGVESNVTASANFYTGATATITIVGGGSHSGGAGQ